MSWPTTRRFPRTLADAFPDAHRAEWSEGWQHGYCRRWADRAMAVAIGLALCAVVVHWIDWSLAK